MGSVTSTMHDDGRMSDASVFAGPFGERAELRYFRNTTARHGGICSSFGIDQRHNVYSISFTRRSATLLRFDPETLDPLNALALPPRSTSIMDALFRPDRIFATNAGAYFYLDNHDRIVLPTVNREIWIVDTPSGSSDFSVRFRMRTGVPEPDIVHATVPVWDETVHGPEAPAPSGYWFFTEAGRIGVVHPDHEEPLATLRLPNEERIANSCAIGKKGVFVVSTRALYRLELVGREIRVVYRVEYERGERKPGQLAPGSGTTPTLLGDLYVAIGDNSAVMNACIHDQDTGALVARREVFADQVGSACENSFIGHGNSIVVSNTFGYRNPLRMRGYDPVPGIVRLDVHAATGRLEQRWYRDDVAPASGIPKLALGNGIIYVYSMSWIERPARRIGRSAAGTWRWTLLGLDFETGRTVYSLPIFEGRRSLDHDNGWGTLAPGPDGSLFIGMWRGAMRVAARPTEPS